MSIATSLTVNSTALYANKIINNDEVPDTSLKANLLAVESDIVEISKLGIVKLQTETEQQSTEESQETASEVVEISSTIGRAESEGRLTHSQATAIYNKISSLL